MEEASCFKCENPLKTITATCTRCGWSGGGSLEESSEKYLVLISLIYRAIENGTKIQPFISRIEATSRELAVLEHGDQCDLDGTKWRIAGKNEPAGTFFIKGFKVVQFPNRRIFEFEADDPVEEIREEMKRWKHLESAYYEMFQLKRRKELWGYLRRSEHKKAVYRSRIQDESPYLS